jgi:RalA-binding protein 1
VQQPPQPVQQQQQQEIVAPATFRQLPLLQADLPHTRITVTQSFVKANDRGKEVLSFTILVDPTGVMPAPHLPRKPGWQVQKMFSDVLGLDQRIRTSLDRSARGGKGSKIMKNLPEGKMWNLKDASPARVDQRKQVLQSYLQHLVDLPLKSNDEVCYSLFLSWSQNCS